MNRESSWTLRDKLILMSAVKKFGDSDWNVISASLKNATNLLSTTSEIFSPANCAAQCSKLLESNQNRRKRIEHTILLDLCVEKLTKEYRDALQKQLEGEKTTILKHLSEIEDLKNLKKELSDKYIDEIYGSFLNALKEEPDMFSDSDVFSDVSEEETDLSKITEPSIGSEQQDLTKISGEKSGDVGSGTGEQPGEPKQPISSTQYSPTLSKLLELPPKGIGELTLTETSSTSDDVRNISNQKVEIVLESKISSASVLPTIPEDIAIKTTRDEGIKITPVEVKLEPISPDVNETYKAAETSFMNDILTENITEVVSVSKVDSKLPADDITSTSKNLTESESPAASTDSVTLDKRPKLSTDEMKVISSISTSAVDSRSKSLDVTLEILTSSNSDAKITPETDTLPLKSTLANSSKTDKPVPTKTLRDKELRSLSRTGSPTAFVKVEPTKTLVTDTKKSIPKQSGNKERQTPKLVPVSIVSPSSTTRTQDRKSSSDHEKVNIASERGFQPMTIKLEPSDDDAESDSSTKRLGRRRHIASSPPHLYPEVDGSDGFSSDSSGVRKSRRKGSQLQALQLDANFTPAQLDCEVKIEFPEAKRLTRAQSKNYGITTPDGSSDSEYPLTESLKLTSVERLSTEDASIYLDFGVIRDKWRLIKSLNRGKILRGDGFMRCRDSSVKHSSTPFDIRHKQKRQKMLFTVERIEKLISRSDLGSLLPPDVIEQWKNRINSGIIGCYDGLRQYCNNALLNKHVELKVFGRQDENTKLRSLADEIWAITYRHASEDSSIPSNKVVEGVEQKARRRSITEAAVTVDSQSADLEMSETDSGPSGSKKMRISKVSDETSSRRNLRNSKVGGDPYEQTSPYSLGRQKPKPSLPPTSSGGRTTRATERLVPQNLDLSLTTSRGRRGTGSRTKPSPD